MRICTVCGYRERASHGRRFIGRKCRKCVNAIQCARHREINAQIKANAFTDPLPKNMKEAEEEVKRRTAIIRAENDERHRRMREHGDLAH